MTQRRRDSLYRLWHQKHPKETRELTVPDLPETVPCIGRALDVDYLSDKWEKDGEFHEYTHTCGSKPKVYCVDPGSYKTDGERRTLSIIGKGSFDSEGLHTAHLAFATQLLLLTPDGSKKTRRFGKDALLLGTLNKKTALILTNTNLYLINGGKFRITERGLVD